MTGVSCLVYLSVFSSKDVNYSLIEVHVAPVSYIDECR